MTAPTASDVRAGRRRRAPDLTALRGRLSNAVTLVVVLALLAGLAVLLWPSGGTRTARAEFVRTVGLYEGSDVRILGVKVGEVTDVRPRGDRVVVDFTYDDEVAVPADAKAVVVAPSVVSATLRSDSPSSLLMTGLPSCISVVFAPVCGSVSVIWLPSSLPRPTATILTPASRAASAASCVYGS